MTPKPLPTPLRALALVVSLSLAFPAFAKDKPKGDQGKKNQGTKPGAADAAIPNADAAGVQKVFGPAYHIWANPGIKPVEGVSKGAILKKGIKVKVGNATKSFDLQMAYEDLAIAKDQRRVYLGTDPFKLPNAVYTWAILANGITSYGKPVDSTEIGTRHMHLSQGEGVVASGELVKSSAGLRLNYSSGTYMIPTFGNQRDPEKLVEPIKTWFNNVLRKKFKGPLSIKVVFKLNGKPTDKNFWGADPIFDVKKNGGDRLPPPTFCQLKNKIKACDAKYVFAKLNKDFCEKVRSFKCN